MHLNQLELGITITAVTSLTEVAMDSMYQTTISTMRKEVGITSKSNPIYHLCRKSGHIVQKCYHRFGLSFSGVNSSHQNLKDTSSTSGFTGNGSSDGMTAMVATRPEFMDDNCSFSYFGATNHVTNDLRKLLSTQNTQELVNTHGQQYWSSYCSYSANFFNSNSHVVHLKKSSSCPSNYQDSTFSFSILCW